MPFFFIKKSNKKYSYSLRNMEQPSQTQSYQYAAHLDGGIQESQRKQERMAREIEDCNNMDEKYAMAKRAVENAEMIAETAQERFTAIRRMIQQNEHAYDEALRSRATEDEKKRLLKKLRDSREEYYCAERVKDQEFKVFTQFLEIERNIMIEMGLIKV
jgi:hypothetical protein